MWKVVLIYASIICKNNCKRGLKTMWAGKLIIIKLKFMFKINVYKNFTISNADSAVEFIKNQGS